MRKVLIVGGTFNPVHTGHVRLAMEAAELLECDGVEIVPSAVPPHKDDAALLPFGLRLAMVHAAVDRLSGFRVSELEGGGEPSYTARTLAAYAAQNPSAQRFFLLGLDDFSHLHQWWRGRDIPQLATVAVAGRAGGGLDAFLQVAQRHWGAYACPASGASSFFREQFAAQAFAQGGHALFLPVTRLDISSTDIRTRWRQGRRLDFLLPDPCLDLLRTHAHEVEHAWRVERQPRTAHAHAV